MTTPHQVAQTQLTAEDHNLAGAVRRRAGRRCRGYGRFPCTGMTGGPAKIIASANGVYGSSWKPA